MNEIDRVFAAPASNTAQPPPALETVLTPWSPKSTLRGDRCDFRRSLPGPQFVQDVNGICSYLVVIRLQPRYLRAFNRDLELGKKRSCNSYKSSVSTSASRVGSSISKPKREVRPEKLTVKIGGRMRPQKARRKHWTTSANWRSRAKRGSSNWSTSAHPIREQGNPDLGIEQCGETNAYSFKIRIRRSREHGLIVMSELESIRDIPDMNFAVGA